MPSFHSWETPETAVALHYPFIPVCERSAGPEQVDRMDGMTVALFSGVFGTLALACALAMGVRRSLGHARRVRQEKPDLPGSIWRRRARRDKEGSDMAHIEGHDLPDCYIPGPQSPILAAMAAVICRKRGTSAAPAPTPPEPPTHAADATPPELGAAPDMVARRATRPQGFGPRKAARSAGHSPDGDARARARSAGPLSGYDPEAEVLVLVWDDAVADAPPRLSVCASEDAPGWHEVRADGVLVGRVPHAGLTEADLRLVPRSRLPD